MGNLALTPENCQRIASRWQLAEFFEWYERLSQALLASPSELMAFRSVALSNRLGLSRENHHVLQRLKNELLPCAVMLRHLRTSPDCQIQLSSDAEDRLEAWDVRVEMPGQRAHRLIQVTITTPISPMALRIFKDDDPGLITRKFSEKLANTGRLPLHFGPLSNRVLPIDDARAMLPVESIQLAFRTGLELTLAKKIEKENGRRRSETCELLIYCPLITGWLHRRAFRDAIDSLPNADKALPYKRVHVVGGSRYQYRHLSGRRV